MNDACSVVTPAGTVNRLFADMMPWLACDIRPATRIADGNALDALAGQPARRPTTEYPGT